MTVTLRDITVETRIEFEQRFLAEVGPLLETGLDYEQSLIAIARLAVQRVGDVCIVDVVEETGGLRRLEAITGDRIPNGIRQALVGAAPDGRAGPAASVVDQKKPILMPRVTPEVLASWAQDEDQARLLRVAAPLSVIAVPLVAHDVLLGVLTMLSTTGSRVYGPADLSLAEEVARRAALSVENSRLYQAARRAVRERDDVLGIVAHDLRNPLSAIVMNATVLSMQAARGGAAAYKPAQAIERAGRRMNRLIQDLLDTTRLDAGQLAIERERLPPGRVIAEAVEAHRPQAASAACELRAELDQQLADVWADRDRLLQIFDNLIGNALKFTGRGGQITVGAKPRDGDVLFSVTDTGCGLTADEIKHLFDRFWQARKKDRRGAGLGLPIVKGLVEAHGGRIWVESTPGGGSTFFFTLPAVTGQPARFTVSGSGASC
ncbi:MAG TPA: GAF domain-containing sensor histidine kinase [Polyangia bacterium]|nr:GAF domain-containing sensor histidine kinase [Polyangia bacterium]